MRILGIDPGLNLCGYAVVDFAMGNYKLVEAGVFRTKANAALEYRLNQIATDIRAIIESFKPEVVSVEQVYSHYEHPQTAVLMGHARGVVLQKAAELKVEVRNFAATRIKKALTGNGRATKEQMQRSIQSLLNLPQMPEPPDVADAIAAALCCANSL
jgi:crossover junction endodeoxyribonuclease RuvC